MINFKAIIDFLGDVIPLAGGLAGLASLGINFLYKSKRIVVVLPQNNIYLRHVHNLFTVYPPQVEKEEVIDEERTIVYADLCIINNSTMDRIIYSIKIEYDGKEFDLDRNERRFTHCHEKFMNVPISVKAQSSVLLKASFKISGKNVMNSEGLKLITYYQNKRTVTKLDKYSSNYFSHELIEGQNLSGTTIDHLY